MKRIKLKIKSKLEKEIKGNIWDFIGIADAITIPTNNYVTPDGRNIMGAGLAKELKERYPKIDKTLGYILDNFGMGPHIIKTIPYSSYMGKVTKTTTIFNFPTKDYWIFVFENPELILPKYRNHPIVKKGGKVPGYMGYSDLELIRNSAFGLRIHIDLYPAWKRVIVAKPGIGYGGLEWDQVKEVLIQTGLYNHPKVQFIEKG